MRLSTNKFVLFMVFAVCLLTTQVAAKHRHKDCDDADHEWDNNSVDWNKGASSSMPIPTYGQSTAYSPSSAPATFLATSSQFYATGIPSIYPSQSQPGSMASVTSMGISITLAAVMFAMVIVA